MPECSFCNGKLEATGYENGRSVFICSECGLEKQGFDIKPSPDDLAAERELKLPKKIYAELIEKYKWCLHCGSPSGRESHHIILRSRGGKTMLINLVRLCGECHDRGHGQVVNGKEPLLIHRNSNNELIIIEHTTNKARVIDEKPHVPSTGDGEAAFALHRVIVDTKTAIENQFWTLGNALMDMRKSELYKVLDYDTFNAYLESPEVSLRRAQVYKLMSIAGHAERLKLEASSLQDIDKDKLAMVLPTATPENVNEKLGEAAGMSRSDLSAIYTNQDAPAPAPVPTEHEHKCNTCGAVNHYPGR